MSISFKFLFIYSNTIPMFLVVRVYLYEIASPFFLCLLWKEYFLHDKPWILPWITSISKDLDITIHMIPSQLSGHYDVISNRLWRHQQKENRASETGGRCVKIIVLSSFMDSLFRNSGNKHKNNPRVSAETVRHSSTSIILYIDCL